jgi:hypothetical protein
MGSSSNVTLNFAATGPVSPASGFFQISLKVIDDTTPFYSTSTSGYFNGTDLEVLPYLDVSSLAYDTKSHNSTALYFTFGSGVSILNQASQTDGGTNYGRNSGSPFQDLFSRMGGYKYNVRFVNGGTQYYFAGSMNSSHDVWSELTGSATQAYMVSPSNANFNYYHGGTGTSGFYFYNWSTGYTPDANSTIEFFFNGSNYTNFYSNHGLSDYYDYKMVIDTSDKSIEFYVNKTPDSGTVTWTQVTERLYLACSQSEI